MIRREIKNPESENQLRVISHILVGYLVGFLIKKSDVKKQVFYFKPQGKISHFSQSVKWTKPVFTLIYFSAPLSFSASTLREESKMASCQLIVVISCFAVKS